MMISDRQARLALDYLRRTQVTRRVRRASDHADISPELLERVMATIYQAPDLREDRVDAAREIVEGRIPSECIADKMIGRLISDDLV
jgi:hypothetical protein